MEIDTNRVQDLANIFKELGINGVKIFEDIDPQYQSISDTVAKCTKELIDVAFYINALNTYKLKMKGEDYWRKYADFIVKHCNELLNYNQLIELVKKFTYIYNNYAYDYKLRRLQKIKVCNKLIDLIKDKKYLELARETAKCLNTSMVLKTIVFAVKIAYYVHKAQGYRYLLPFELPIPVDIRVTYISYMSGLLRADKEINKQLINKTYRNTNIIRYVWSKIAGLSQIPALHIDSVIWYFGKFSNVSSRVNILRNIDKQLYDRINKNILERLVNEIFYRLDY